MKKAIFTLLAASMLLSMAGCSGMGGGKEFPTAPAENRPVNSSLSSDIYENGGSVFSKQLISLPDDEVSISDAAYADGCVYMLGHMRGGESLIYIMDTSLDISRLALPEGLSVYKLCARGNRLCALGVDEQGAVVILTAEQWGDWAQLPLPAQDEYENTVIADIAATDSGYVIFTADKVFALDFQGNKLMDLGNYHRYGGCFPSDTGGFVLITEVLEVGAESPVTKTRIFDSVCNLVESYTSAKQFTAFFDYSAENGTIICKNLNTVFEFDFGEDISSPLINMNLSGASGAALICFGGNSYFAISQGIPYILRETDGNERTTLTLAAYNLDLFLSDYIGAYNESGAKYNINVVDYAQYDEAGGEGQGLARLQSDIISGKTPDLYDLSRLPAKLYAEHGIFEDLKPYLSTPKNIYGELVESAVKALEYKDALYYIAPSFEAITLCGNKSFVGNKGNWTNENFFAAVNGFSPVEILGPEVTRAAFLAYLLQFQGDEYIDYDEQKCSFVNTDFERFLEFARGLPDECDLAAMDSQPSGRAFMGKQQLLISPVGNGGISFLAFNDTIFGGEAQYVGFPSNFNGVALSPTSLVGVSVSSGCKDGALDFIKFILGDTVQSSITACPIVKAQLTARMDKWEKQYLGYPANLYTICDGLSVTIEGETDLNTAKSRLTEIINRIDCSTLYDEEILKIMLRESQPYFAGVITSADAAANIQSLVNIYLSEQYG